MMMMAMALKDLDHFFLVTKYKKSDLNSVYIITAEINAVRMCKEQINRKTPKRTIKNKTLFLLCLVVYFDLLIMLIRGYACTCVFAN